MRLVFRILAGIIVTPLILLALAPAFLITLPLTSIELIFALGSFARTGKWEPHLFLMEILSSFVPSN